LGQAGSFETEIETALPPSCELLFHWLKKGHHRWIRKELDDREIATGSLEGSQIDFEVGDAILHHESVKILRWCGLFLSRYEGRQRDPTGYRE
jgi:hypothetical protein